MRSRLLSKGRPVALANGIGPGLQRGSLGLMLLWHLGKADMVEILRPDAVTEAVLGGPVSCHASKANLKLEEELSRNRSAGVKNRPRTCQRKRPPFTYSGMAYVVLDAP